MPAPLSTSTVAGDSSEIPALNPPENRDFTIAELAQYDGIQSDKIYVAIKGTVFDVTYNKDSYGPDAGYHVFAGKEATRALAKSSLDPKDCVPEYEDLPESDLAVLDDWYQFFLKRYSIVGKIGK